MQRFFDTGTRYVRAGKSIYSMSSGRYHEMRFCQKHASVTDDEIVFWGVLVAGELAPGMLVVDL
jgi:hypothetical protein